MRRPSLGQRFALVVATLTIAHAASAGATPEQICQKGRYGAAAKYAACEQKVTGTLLGGGLATYQALASKCRTKYAATWGKLKAQASGTGATCDAARLRDNGDGTVTDRLTGLQWEQKTDDASVHDKDNLYIWSAGGGAFTAADGTVFTSFLATLNAGGCFAGQCDWRLPTRGELQAILSEAYPCTTSPCIDTAFGPTLQDDYWSSSTNPFNPGSTWVVDFIDGFLTSGIKAEGGYVRAVRAGL